jgi:hypothetical protein
MTNEIVCGVAIFAVIAVLYFAFRRERYIRKIGIQRTPQTFIELAERKPLVIKINERFDFVMGYEGSVADIIALQRIQHICIQIKKATELENIAAQERTVQTLYIALASVLITLSEKHVKRKERKAYRKALIEKCIASVQWMYDVCSEINDFHALIKKKVDLLATGSTLRQTHGETYTWDLWSEGYRLKKQAESH